MNHFSPALGRRSTLMLLAILITLVGTGAAPAQEPLERGFQSPPPECRPDVFMDWMGGMLSREGLKKDFEAMAREGIGGVLVMQMPDQLAGVTHWSFRDYPGKIKCLSDEWFATVNFAIGEADRLGLTFSMLPCPGWSHVGGPWVTPDKSGKILVGGSLKLQGPSSFQGVIPRPPLRHVDSKLNPNQWMSKAEAAGWKKLKESFGDFYRDMAVFAYPADAGTAKEPVSQDRILDLTNKMDAQGRLTWDVPAGQWTVVRLGLESCKEPNYPAEHNGAGLECDRMDPGAVRLVLDNYLGRIVREARAKGYKSFKGFDTDSYESVFQDFSPDFPEQFKKRLGYDCLPWLPAWLDKKLVIGNPDLTRRFQRDMLHVVSELWLERFYGEIRSFAEANKIQWMIEPYFLMNIDWRTVASRSHIPGSEFWVRDLSAPPNPFAGDLTGPAPDTAALYGHKVVWAESFTAGSENSAWRNDPWLLKPFGDAAFCRGINHFVMHGFVHNPFGDNLRPGFSFGGWGTQLGRNVTWWPYASAWHKYLARCQFLLTQGLPVADVLAYPPKTEHIPSPVLECAPYKQNVSNDEVLLDRLSVKDGRLVLPHGVSYAALAIPSQKGWFTWRSMTPQALRRIRDLVAAGATLIGEPIPDKSVSMQGYPACDQQMARLVAEIWGAGKVASQGERRVGKGRVIWGRPLTEVLGEVAGGPDFEFTGLPQFAPGKNYNPRYDFFHRRTPEAEIYFVANLYDEPIERAARFRVTGRKPELWDAVTGRIRPLPEYREEQGHTVIPLRLAARQSVFVIFRSTENQGGKNENRDGGPGVPSVPADARNFPQTKLIATLEGPWQVAFDPKWGGPEKAEFSALGDWSQRPEPGIKYYSGTAAYTKTFDLGQFQISNFKSQIYLDMGKVRNLARVRLNGKDLGIVWCAPWRVEITGAVQEKGNQLEIDVVNTWVNRIIGDEQEPPDTERVAVQKDTGGYKAGVTGLALKDLPDWMFKGQPRPTRRYTFSNWQFYPKDAPLPESGLLGPVRIVAER